MRCGETTLCGTDGASGYLGQSSQAGFVVDSGVQRIQGVIDIYISTAVLAIYTSLSSHLVSPAPLTMSLSDLPTEILLEIQDCIEDSNFEDHHSLMHVGRRTYDVYHPTREAFWAKVAKALDVAKPRADTTMRLGVTTMRWYDILRVFVLHLRRCEECAQQVGNPRSGITRLLSFLSLKCKIMHWNCLVDDKTTSMQLHHTIKYEEAYLNWNVSSEYYIRHHATTLFRIAATSLVKIFRIELAEDDAFAVTVSNPNGVTQLDIFHKLHELLGLSPCLKINRPPKTCLQGGRYLCSTALAYCTRPRPICPEVSMHANRLLEKNSPRGVIAASV